MNHPTAGCPNCPRETAAVEIDGKPAQACDNCGIVRVDT